MVVVSGFCYVGRGGGTLLGMRLVQYISFAD